MVPVRRHCCSHLMAVDGATPRRAAVARADPALNRRHAAAAQIGGKRKSHYGWPPSPAPSLSHQPMQIRLPNDPIGLEKCRRSSRGRERSGAAATRSWSPTPAPADASPEHPCSTQRAARSALSSGPLPRATKTPAFDVITTPSTSATTRVPSRGARAIVFAPHHAGIRETSSVRITMCRRDPLARLGPRFTYLT